MQSIIDYLTSIQSIDDTGPLMAVLLSLLWVWGAVSMVIRAAKNSRLENPPVHTQRFYLLQAWVYFGWVFPMFLLFEAMEAYVMAPY